MVPYSSSRIILLYLVVVTVRNPRGGVSYPLLCVCIVAYYCTYVCVFIKLLVTAQYGPDLLEVILCYYIILYGVIILALVLQRNWSSKGIGPPKALILKRGPPKESSKGVLQRGPPKGSSKGFLQRGPPKGGSMTLVRFGFNPYGTKARKPLIKLRFSILYLIDRLPERPVFHEVL